MFGYLPPAPSKVTVGVGIWGFKCCPIHEISLESFLDEAETETETETVLVST